MITRNYLPLIHVRPVGEFFINRGCFLARNPSASMTLVGTTKILTHLQRLVNRRVAAVSAKFSFAHDSHLQIKAPASRNKERHREWFGNGGGRGLRSLLQLRNRHLENTHKQ